LRRTPAKAGVTAGFANANHHLPRLPRNSGLLSWSGLRGGIAVALALSSPASPYREALATAACGIAIFTMVSRG
jgi:NhaP-type Na+/H+ or K+/H+ antiporter